MDYQNIVSSWYKNLGKTGSQADIKSAETLIPLLDYTEASQVQLEDKSILTLVKITGNQNIYLGIKNFLGDIFNFDGIYLSKKMTFVRQLLTAKTLPAIERIVVFDLNKRPAKGWESDKSGKLLQSIVRQQQNSNKVKKTRLQSTKMTYNSWEDCELIFWITWETETGKLLSATYLGNTCDNQPISFIDPGVNPGEQIHGGGDNGGIVVDEELAQYNAALLDFQQETEEAGALNYSKEGSPNMSEVPGEEMTRNWREQWVCLNGKVGWKLLATATGKLRAWNEPGHPWTFKSVSHAGIEFQGTEPWTTEISFTQGSALWNITDENAAQFRYLSAIVELKFTVTYKFKPPPLLNGWARQFASSMVPPVTKSYTSYGAWKLS